METFAHQALKWLAIDFLRARGCPAVAMEVVCPIARYRLDVAGFRDRPRPARRGDTAVPHTIIVECKQSRADFLRDGRRLERLLGLRAGLERIRGALERQIMRDEPELRRCGSSLFPDLDDWDFTATRRASYRRVLERLDRVDARLHGGTKFCHLARYRLADQLFLAAPRGMIRRCEVPAGWGLVECPSRWLDERRAETPDSEPPTLSVRVEAPVLGAPERRRQRLLRNIAVSASVAQFGRRAGLADLGRSERSGPSTAGGNGRGSRRRSASTLW